MYLPKWQVHAALVTRLVTTPTVYLRGLVLISGLPSTHREATAGRGRRASPAPRVGASRRPSSHAGCPICTAGHDLKEPSCRACPGRWLWRQLVAPLSESEAPGLGQRPRSSRFSSLRIPARVRPASARPGPARRGAAYVLVLVLGLRREDADLDRAEMTIGWQIQRVDGKLLHRETKTQASDATPYPSWTSSPRLCGCVSPTIVRPALRLGKADTRRRITKAISSRLHQRISRAWIICSQWCRSLDHGGTALERYFHPQESIKAQAGDIAPGLGLSMGAI